MRLTPHWLGSAFVIQLYSGSALVPKRSYLSKTCFRPRARQHAVLAA